jgi:hypothetical protein
MIVYKIIFEADCEACICYDVDSEVILNCDCECHHATQ